MGDSFENIATLVWLPLAGGAAIYVLWLLFGWIGRARGKVFAPLAWLVRLIAIAAVAWTLGTAITIWQSGKVTGSLGLRTVNLGPVDLSFNLLATGLSSFIVLAATGISLVIVIYSIRGMAGNRRGPVFYAYLLWALAGANAVALADNFVFLLLAWEGVTVLLFLMINLGGAEARAGAAKTFAMLGFADVCMLFGIVILMVKGGNPALSLSAAKVAIDGPFSYICYILFMIAAMAKAGAMPLHTWVPAASTGAPTSVFAFLPAALDKLLGIYLLARVSLDVFRLDGVMAAVLMVIGAATIIFAVMMAMIQHNLKRLLSFHAVSQVGYMVLGIGVGAAVLAAGGPGSVAAVAVCGGLFHMFNNAIYKCNLFLMAGAVENAGGSMELDRLGGLARSLPITFACGLVAALAISGVPPLNGFVSKWFVYQGCVQLKSGLGLACLVVAVFGSALTLASFVKVLHSVFLGSRTEETERITGVRESGWMVVAMIALALVCIGFGVWGSWAVATFIIPAAAATGVDTSSIQTAAGALDLEEVGGLWSPTVATGLILIGIAVGLIIYSIGRVMRPRIVPTFVGGEDAEAHPEMQFPGTGFYETIRRIKGLQGVYTDADAGAFDLYRLGGGYGRRVVEHLRRWHTGVLTVYIAWTLIGLGVVILYMVLAGR